MLRYLIFSLVFMMSLAPALCPAAGKKSRAEEVRLEAEQTVVIQAATQKLREEHHLRASELADRMEDLERELKDITRNRQKTEAYLADQQSKIAELERRLAQSKIIGRDLEPVLDRALARLKQPGTESPPELAYGRREVAGLSRLLNNYDAPLSQKTGRVLEILKLQARLGSRVVVQEMDLTIDSRIWRVKLIRLGRLVLFALTTDGRRAWQYQPADRTFIPVDRAAGRLAKLAEISQGRRLAELIKVPLSLRVDGRGPGADVRGSDK